MHVPFKGAAEATKAILSHIIDFQFASTSGVMGNVRSGKLLPLAISGRKRTSVLSKVPTFSEAGVKNFQGVVNWTGLWAPRGTPPAVIERLQKEILTAMAAPDMKSFADNMGIEARCLDANAFKKMLSETSVMWGNVASKINFQKH